MYRREALRRAALLSGATLSFSLSSAILSGCKPQPTLNWQPTFHNPEEAQALTVIGDIILPASDSPAASSVNVPSFIDLIAQECMTSDEKIAWREGLQSLLEAYREENGHDMLRGDASEQAGFIRELDSQAFKDASELSVYYRMLKNLVLVGYFTSETVMTSHLDHHAIPGRYDGCVPYEGQPVYVDNNVDGRIA